MRSDRELRRKQEPQNSENNRLRQVKRKPKKVIRNRNETCRNFETLRQNTQYVHDGRGKKINKKFEKNIGYSLTNV